MDSEEDSFIQCSMPMGPEGSCVEETPEGGCVEETPEGIQQEIKHCKELCKALEKDCAELQEANEAAEQRMRELKKEGELLRINLEQQLSSSRDEEKFHQMGIILAKEERSTLRQKQEMLKKKLEEVKKRVLWADPVRMLPALPEKKMVFKGLVTNEDDVDKLVLTPLIRYPLLGGSALITFEKEEVAQRIVELKEHMVELSYGLELEELERCRMRVQAAPVDLLLPSVLEIGLTWSSRSLLLSGLPSLSIPKEILLDKLQLFFSKTKNGGGEVESSEVLDDSSVAVLTFVQDGVAERLITRGRMPVLIGKGKYELKISPCMRGDVTSLQPSRCPRTVLLTGIPDILGEEPMQDTLEIHFQKASHGGGEVDALAYVPVGCQAVAVFTQDMV